MKKSIQGLIYSSLFLSSFFMSSQALSSTQACLKWYNSLDEKLVQNNYSGDQKGYDVVKQLYLRNFEYLCGFTKVSGKALSIFKQIDFSKKGWENNKVQNDFVSNHIQNLKNKISEDKKTKDREKRHDFTQVDKEHNVDTVATCLELKDEELCSDITEKQISDYNEIAKRKGQPETSSQNLKKLYTKPTLTKTEAAVQSDKPTNQELKSNSNKNVKDIQARGLARENSLEINNDGTTAENKVTTNSSPELASNDINSEEAPGLGTTESQNTEKEEAKNKASLSRDEILSKPEQLASEGAKGAGEAYDISANKDVDENGSFNVGTEDNPIMIPGGEINNINKEINTCIKEKTPEVAASEKQQVQETCKNEAIASCQKEGGYCETMKSEMTQGDDNVASMEETVHELSADDIKRLSVMINVEGINCLSHFTDKTSNEKHHGYDFISNHRDLPFLKETFKINEQGNISNDVPSGSGMYLTENSCQTVLGGDESFTESQLEIRNPKKFCRDTFQAAFHRNIKKPKSACYQAMELLRSEEVSGTSCFEQGGGTDGKGIEPISATDVCMKKYNISFNDLKNDAQGDALRSCAEDERAIHKSNSEKRRVKKSCINAYEAVDACLKESTEDETVTKLRLVSGCVSLAQIAAELRTNHLDAGEENDGYQSLGSKVTCVVKAPDSRIYAMDYLSCRNAAQWYNGAFVGTDMLSPVLSNAYEAYKSSDIQSDQMINNAKGGVDAQTAGFNAQKRQYNLKANTETTKGIMEGGKAMAMFGNMMRYATPKIISYEHCKEGSSDSNLSNIHFCNISYMAEKNSNIKKNLFPNQNMKRVLLNIGFQSLSKAIIHAIVAGTYKKRSNLVGKVEKALKEAEFNQPENQIDLGFSYCQQNPNARSCRNNGGNLQDVGGVDFSFDGITPQGTGSLDFEEGENSGFVSSNNAVKPTDEEYNKLGDLMNPSSDKQLGKDFNKVGAAKVGSGGGGSGGGSGGGGGGGGGAATAPGGGGGSKGGGDNQYAGDFGKKGGVSYRSGSGGRNMRSGGTARSKKSNKKNPFSAFGKGKSGRSIASKVNKQLLPKKSRLFEVISRRYTKVNNSGGLMKVQD